MRVIGQSATAQTSDTGQSVRNAFNHTERRGRRTDGRSE